MPAGSDVTLSVTATGTEPFTYQWQFNGTNLPNDIITTVAGGGNGGDGAATNASLNFPFGVAVDAMGNLFIAETGNQRIRKVDTNGIITTVAGNGIWGYSGDGGAATNASFLFPLMWRWTLPAICSLRIRQQSRPQSGHQRHHHDGGWQWHDRLLRRRRPGHQCQLEISPGVALDAAGNLFIADSGSSVIRKVDTNGIITTVAGNGTAGYSGDGGAATNASLNQPNGVAVDASGNLFIADIGNNASAKWTPTASSRRWRAMVRPDIPGTAGPPPMPA